MRGAARTRSAARNSGDSEEDGAEPSSPAASSRPPGAAPASPTVSMAAAAGIPPQLAALVNKQQKFADVYNRASAERRNAMRLDGLRAPHYPGTPFSLPRSAPDADVELLQHLPRLPRVLDANLFHAEHD